MVISSNQDEPPFDKLRMTIGTFCEFMKIEGR
jgi:hypothetical protein